MKIIGFMRENGAVITVQHAFSTIKSKIFNRLLSLKFATADKINIHPNAYIRGASHISIGANFQAGRLFWLEAVTRHGGRIYDPHIVIKDNVALNESVHIAATNYVEIGNNVLMASKIYISDHNHGEYQGINQSDPRLPPNSRIVTSNLRVVIGDNVWIGEFVSILAGAIIGEGCIIGSNSVVTKEIPPYSIAVGCPAKVIKRYDFEEKKWIAVQCL